MKKPNVYLPDWIQTIVVVVALLLAIWELYLKSDAPRLEKAQNTVELLREGYDEKILNSLDVFVAGPSRLHEATNGDFAAALVLLTPFHEYLVAFSVCYDTGLCLQKESLQFLCPRLRAYEATIPRLYSEFKTSMPAKRPLRNTTAWKDCAKENSLATNLTPRN